MPQLVPYFDVSQILAHIAPFYNILTTLFVISVFVLFLSLWGLYLCYDTDIISKPMTGVRCPTCAANGQESWVIPGKTCGYCGTGC